MLKCSLRLLSMMLLSKRSVSSESKLFKLEISGFCLVSFGTQRRAWKSKRSKACQFLEF